MRKGILKHFLAVGLLMGCAEKSANVQGSYVSPISYEAYSCRQLAEEASRLSSRASEISGVQDKNATSDAVVTGVSLVVFWPAAFFIHGNKGNSAELARLKGEKDAVEQAVIAKECSVKFKSNS
jgi:hypothetical protein